MRLLPRSLIGATSEESSPPIKESLSYTCWLTGAAPGAVKLPPITRDQLLRSRQSLCVLHMLTSSRDGWSFGAFMALLAHCNFPSTLFTQHFSICCFFFFRFCRRHTHAPVHVMFESMAMQMTVTDSYRIQQAALHQHCINPPEERLRSASGHWVMFRSVEPGGFLILSDRTASTHRLPAAPKQTSRDGSQSLRMSCKTVGSKDTQTVEPACVVLQSHQSGLVRSASAQQMF